LSCANKSVRYHWAGAIRLSLVAALLLASVPAGASEFIVNSTDDAVDATPGDGHCETLVGNHICTLRAAVMEANKASGFGATITLPAGTYKLILPATLADGEDGGDLNLTVPQVPSSLTVITINGAGAATTIIDAQQNDRVFNVAVGRTARISGVSIINGLTVTALGGGGIYNAGDLTVNDCILSGNIAAAADGGGILNEGAFSATRVTFSVNTATNGHGGGIASHGDSVTLTNSVLSGNLAAGDGGGIFMGSGSLTLNHSSLGDNIASSGRGGGIFTNGSTTISYSTVSDNTAGDYGGGIDEDPSGTLEINTSTISGNSATFRGGGIANFGQLILRNSTLSQNHSKESGAGVWNWNEPSASASVYNSTIVFNQADSDANGSGVGGGAYIGVDSVFSIRNTVIAGNTRSSPVIADDCSGFLVIYGNNRLSTAAGCTAATGDPGSTAALIGSLSELGVLANNGGPSKTIALIPPSTMNRRRRHQSGMRRSEQRGNGHRSTRLPSLRRALRYWCIRVQPRVHFGNGFE